MGPCCWGSDGLGVSLQVENGNLLFGQNEQLLMQRGWGLVVRAVTDLAGVSLQVDMGNEKVRVGVYPVRDKVNATSGFFLMGAVRNNRRTSHITARQSIRRQL